MIGARHGPGATLTPDDLEYLARLFRAQGRSGLIPATLTGNILVDPQGLFHGSDTNPPTITVAGLTGPCFRTWAGIVLAWGTVAPLLTADTTITFLNSQLTDSDKVVCRAIVAKGAQLRVQGLISSAQQVTAGVISGTVGKSTSGAGQLLTVTLTSGLIAGLLLINSTHISVSFLDTNPSGNSWTLTQPLLPYTFPDPNNFSPFVDTTTNGDSWVAYQLVGVHVSVFAPEIIGYDPAFDNVPALYRLQLLDPLGPGGNVTELGPHSQIYECNIQSLLLTASSVSDIFQTIGNCFNNGGLIASKDAGYGLFQILAGVTTSTAFSFSMEGLGTRIDGNHYARQIITVCNGGATIGLAFVPTGSTLQVSGLPQFNGSGAGAYGNAVLYGAGTLSIIGPSRGEWDSNDGSATQIFQLTGGIMLNKGTTASAYDASADPAVWHPGRTITPAHLDGSVAAGGFGPFGAINPGGACLVEGEFT